MQAGEAKEVENRGDICEMGNEAERQEQILWGNDRKKSNAKSKGGKNAEACKCDAVRKKDQQRVV
jgi:hypothetical protein